MAIAGGVRAEDLKAGRAAGLRSPDVVRTLGSKLNYATTLWDYINRAMPWTAPQSLIGRRGVRRHGLRAEPERDRAWGVRAARMRIC